jgi:hypothetical protein
MVLLFLFLVCLDVVRPRAVRTEIHMAARQRLSAMLLNNSAPIVMRSGKQPRATVVPPAPRISPYNKNGC